MRTMAGHDLVRVRRRLDFLLALLAACAILVAGCATPGWDGRVERWGSLREVLRDGDKQGRVLIESTLTAEATGLGALGGLEGEILILDGVAWIGRGAAEGATVELAAPDDQAAFLVLARVPSWRTLEIESEIDVTALDPRELGAPDARTIPFIVEGELADLELHVLRGRCPYDAEDPDGAEPLRRSVSATRGTLVGFWTSEPPGLLTHHGSNVHVHVLLGTPGDAQGVVGHVDSARVLPGASVRIPGTSSP